MSESMWNWASQVVHLVKNTSAMQETQETQVQSLGQGDPLEEGNLPGAGTWDPTHDKVMREKI